MGDKFWETIIHDKEIINDEYGESYIVFENVLVNLELNKDKITIDDIISHHQGMGYASKALREICKLADQLNVVLDLYPHPTKKQGLNKESLKEWYNRYGFYGENEWRRIPNHSFKSS